MATMSPAKPRPAAMTPAAFNKLLKANGLSRTKAAEVLGVGRRTVIRWGTGETPISRQVAALIRSVLG